MRTEVGCVERLPTKQLRWEPHRLTQLFALLPERVEKQWPLHPSRVLTDVKGTEAGEEHHPPYRAVARLVAGAGRETRVWLQL